MGADGRAAGQRAGTEGSAGFGVGIRSMCDCDGGETRPRTTCHWVSGARWQISVPPYCVPPPTSHASMHLHPTPMGDDVPGAPGCTWGGRPVVVVLPVPYDFAPAASSPWPPCYCRPAKAARTAKQFAAFHSLFSRVRDVTGPLTRAVESCWCQSAPAAPAHSNPFAAPSGEVADNLDDTDCQEYTQLSTGLRGPLPVR